jgi:hypothetical protein
MEALSSSKAFLAIYLTILVKKRIVWETNVKRFLNADLLSFNSTPTACNNKQKQKQKKKTDWGF